MFVSLAPVKWFLVKESDAIEALRRGGFSGGYRHAASAQSIYFPDGSISEALWLAEKLEELKVPFPTADEARVLHQSIEDECSIYRFNKEGDVWRFINNVFHGECFSPVETAWRLFIENGEEYIQVEIPEGAFLDVLQVFSLLTGTLSLDDLASHIKDGAPKELVCELAASGLLCLSEMNDPAIDDIPDVVFLGHSGLLINGGDGLVAIDPVVMPSNEKIGMNGRDIWALLRRSEAVLISHHHWDHLHLQTLVRLSRETMIIVPKCRRHSFSNPCMRSYLEMMGFVNVVEVEPGGKHSIGGVSIDYIDFFGEPFGLDSHFDAFTYYLKFKGKTLFGSLDACHDETGSMDSVIGKVAELGAPDYFFFGASGQKHENPLIAPGLRYLSNELKDYPDLIRYHPDVDDIERWVSMLAPRYLVPYAEFIFFGHPSSDLNGSTLDDMAIDSVRSGKAGMTRDLHLAWVSKLEAMAEKVKIPLVLLQPMQGIS